MWVIGGLQGGNKWRIADLPGQAAREVQETGAACEVASRPGSRNRVESSNIRFGVLYVPTDMLVRS